MTPKERFSPRHHGAGAIAALVTLAALMFAPATARAQLDIKGGLSFSNVSNNGLLPGTSGQRTGFAAGVGLSTGGLIGFGAEALYDQQGVTSTALNNDHRLSYIDIPVYLRVSLPSPMVSPFAYVGPQASMELNCDNGGTGSCPDTGRPKTTFAAVIGAGARLGVLSLEGRYVYGVTDLKLITSTSNFQTRSFLLLVGLGM
jgi:hypothetical protein